MRRVVLLYEETDPTHQGRCEHQAVLEWCAPRVRTHAKCGLGVIPSAATPDLLAALYRNEFFWTCIDEATPPLRRILKRLDIRSIGCAPFFVDGCYAGCLAFEDGAMPSRRWEAPQVDALTAAANVIGAAVQRQRLAGQLAAGQERCALLRRADETLLRGAERLAADQRVSSFVEAILAAAVRLVGAHAGSVSLRVPGNATTFRLLASWEGTVLSTDTVAADPFLGRLEEISAADPDGVFSSLAHGENSIIKVKDMRRHRRIAYDYHIARGHQVVWRFPLVLLGQVLGFFCLSLTHDREFSEVERETVAILSRQLVLALELTRLGERARESAVILEREKAAQERASAALQERNRLAGEIHDTLAQGFASMLLHAEGAAEALRRAPAQLPAMLEKIKVLARSSLAEARRSVWTLRAPAPQEATFEDLPTTLSRLSKSLRAEIVMSAAAPRPSFRLVGAVRPLPPEMESELVRIGQEALRNAIRHARATRITITLKYFSGRVELRVADNGCGLPRRPGMDGYSLADGAGLCFMRERAARLGGELFLSNAPRHGTIVVARVPTADAGSTP